MDNQSPLIFYVNQQKVVETQPDPEESLLYYLRRKLHLTGTKLTCGEGGCGACTVTVSKAIHNSNGAPTVQHQSINACLAPLCSMHGCSITTVEGIGSYRNLHPIQDRIAKCHGSQCGFCTPGIVMSAYSALMANGDGCKMIDIEDAVQANLCRCTGYRPIVHALRSLAVDAGDAADDAGNSQTPEDLVKKGRARKLFDLTNCDKFDVINEPQLPRELMSPERWNNEELQFSMNSVTWHRVSNLQQLVKLKQQFTDAKIVNGSTEISIEQTQRNLRYGHVIHPAGVEELHKLAINEESIVIGAAVTMTELLQLCKKIVQDENVPERKKKVPAAFLEMLQLFAGQQIRNVSAVGGNVMTASPIADLNPLLMSAGAQLVFASVDGSRTVAMDDQFFTGYRKTAARPHEVLTQIVLPLCQENQEFFGFKQARRRDDDIAIVNAGMFVEFAGGKSEVSQLRLTFGGMAPTTKMALETAQLLVGRRWDSKLLELGLAELRKELRLDWNAPGGQAEYRMTLVTSFFYRFFHLVSRQLASRQISAPAGADDLQLDDSALSSIPREFSSSSQMFDEVPDGQLSVDPIGRPLIHANAYRQTTGEAEYLDDLPEGGTELFMAPVLSQKANVVIESIDYSEALAMDGVVGVADYRDVQVSNFHGDIVRDERVFAEGTVRYVGEFVAAVVAKGRKAARRAAQAVKVNFKEAGAPIVTVSDAVEADCIFEEKWNKLFEAGDVEADLSNSAFVVEDEVQVGGQEHFYFEPFSCLVVPKDRQELEIFASSQAPSGTQEAVSTVTGIPRNHVTVRVKRLGGGFGGKELRTNLLYTPAAVCAVKFNRPVRAILDRWDDMAVSGGRNPIRATYRLGADADGRLTGLELKIFQNAGCTMDLSSAVAGRMLRACLETYKMKSARIEVKLCKTNLPSNTAFRAFGTPQGYAVMETAMSTLAEKLEMQQHAIRELNFYKGGEVTLNGSPIKDDNLHRCWNECLRISNYRDRCKQVAEFNASSSFKKRGIAMSPIVYGIGFGFNSGNQAGALVNIYLDGSVLVTHAGVEMGQGLHTKLLQVASRVLNIPIERIFISETATDKVPNTSPTAASITTDLNAPAVMDACQQLKDRLSHFMHTNPKGQWSDWVNSAYRAGISLSATGYCHNPAPDNIDNRTSRGDGVLYFTYGAACSEVEVDTLTGDHVVKRSDIVMDLGASLNPAIDIGQVEGAFVQGYGFYTLEELRYSPDGHLYTKGPGAYKIPGFSDIPQSLNVYLLQGSLCEHPKAVYSSKAVGEPPLNLAVSIFMAIRSAVMSRRLDCGLQGQQLRWHSPATSERIRLSCADFLVVKNEDDNGRSTNGRPWEVKASE